jgi:hypothetical protein
LKNPSPSVPHRPGAASPAHILPFLPLDRSTLTWTDHTPSLPGATAPPIYTLAKSWADLQHIHALYCAVSVTVNKLVGRIPTELDRIMAKLPNVELAFENGTKYSTPRLAKPRPTPWRSWRGGANERNHKHPVLRLQARLSSPACCSFPSSGCSTSASTRLQ